MTDERCIICGEPTRRDYHYSFVPTGLTTINRNTGEIIRSVKVDQYTTDVLRSFDGGVTWETTERYVNRPGCWPTVFVAARD